MIRVAVLSVLLLAAVPCFAQDMPLTQVLIPGEQWELVAKGYQFTEGPAVDRQGNVFFVDVPCCVSQHSRLFCASSRHFPVRQSEIRRDFSRVSSVKP